MSTENWSDFHHTYHSNEYHFSSKNENLQSKSRGELLQSADGCFVRKRTATNLPVRSLSPCRSVRSLSPIRHHRVTNNNKQAKRGTMQRNEPNDPLNSSSHHSRCSKKSNNNTLRRGVLIRGDSNRSFGSSCSRGSSSQGKQQILSSRKKMSSSDSFNNKSHKVHREEGLRKIEFSEEVLAELRKAASFNDSSASMNIQDTTTEQKNELKEWVYCEDALKEMLRSVTKNNNKVHRDDESLKIIDFSEEVLEELRNDAASFNGSSLSMNIDEATKKEDDGLTEWVYCEKALKEMLNSVTNDQKPNNMESKITNHRGRAKRRNAKLEGKRSILKAGVAA